MTGPLVFLAVPSVAIGILNAPGVETFATWVRYTIPGVEFEPPEHHFNTGLALLSTAVAVTGIVLATWIWYYQRAPKGVVARSASLRALRTFLVEKYYLDRIFVDGVVGSIKGPIAQGAYWVNQRVIDGIVNAIGIGAKGLARVTYDWVDQKGVDGVVNGLGAGASESGALLRVIQSGQVQQYALILFAAVGLLGFVLIFVQ
jgi:NADH-quinone oxidoreductase subunit L